MIRKKEKGVSLLFVVMIISVILSIGLGLSSIFIQQSRMTRDVGKSIVSFYAADSGIEAQLFNIYSNLYGSGVPDYSSPSNQNLTAIGANSSVSALVSVACGQALKDDNKCPDKFLPNTEPCDESNFCLKSVGSYGDSQRVIQLKY